MQRMATAAWLGLMLEAASGSGQEPWENPSAVLTAPRVFAASPYAPSMPTGWTTVPAAGPATGPLIVSDSIPIWSAADTAPSLLAPSPAGAAGAPPTSAAIASWTPPPGYVISAPRPLIPLSGQAIYGRPVITYRPVVAAPAALLPAEYRLGAGVFGQPKVYLPGQPVRNFLRSLSP